MDLIFFMALPEEATGVRSSGDLPAEMAADPISIGDPGVLMDIGAALGLAGAPAARQLRDATCQSFPVWTLTREVCERLAGLEEHQIDDLAKAWETGTDADLYERARCFSDLRSALRVRAKGERLFVLFEERAF